VAGVHIAKRRDALAITKPGVRRQLLFKAFSPAIPAPYDATVSGAHRHPIDREDLMRKSLVAWSFACVVLAAGTAAQAEMATTPGPTPYGETINIEQAKKLATAAAAEAKKNNWFMAISVVGPAGDLVYFEKMDNTQYASVAISQHKARVAATFRRPTKVFEENLAKGAEFIYQLTLDGMIGSQGGIPIVVGGKLIGAIGCSGGTGPQDLQTCTAGLAALQ
jgi:glc operon protein GlcG